ncbi:acetyltransferase [Bacillus sp. 1P10SD]|uniref:acetyltransferase n=1 Tax=Bacillus sp. 1P10SD TaxID=3132265 RepID=UPI0039A6A013
MRVILIGQGGHSKVISDIIRATKNHKLVGYLDDRYKSLDIIENFISGPVSAANFIKKVHQDIKFIIAIGDNKTRKKIFHDLGLSKNDYLTLVHPTAYISPDAKVGQGTIIMPKSVINSDAVIGDHCIINTGSVVEHDSMLEDFVHLCPNSTIAGTVSMGEGACLGTGGTIIPNKRIGEWTMIGAGATVVNDLPSHCLAVGIPARIKINNQINAV